MHLKLGNRVHCIRVSAVTNNHSIILILTLNYTTTPTNFIFYFAVPCTFTSKNPKKQFKMSEMHMFKEFVIVREAHPSVGPGPVNGPHVDCTIGPHLRIEGPKSM